MSEGWTSRQRVLAALAHEEPDHVPFDMGATHVTGIHAVAYRRLRETLGLPVVKPHIYDVIQGLAFVDDDVVEHLEIDARGLFPLYSHNWNVDPIDAGRYWEYTDDYGIVWQQRKEGGLYYSVVRSPFANSDLNIEVIRAHSWPDNGDTRRIAGLREQALAYHRQGKAVVLKGVMGGTYEFTTRLRGMENLLLDLVTGSRAAEALLDKTLELRLQFWEMALPRLADVVDVICESDDYGGQTSLIMSPEMFRRFFKPRLRVIFQTIKKLAPHAYVFLHCCGSIRPIIPDLIEVGVDILNPVQKTANDMELASLKRDFGSDITFWGGGVDTQGVLVTGMPQEVRDDVERSIEALAPGGGYVFNTIHNIQPDVPAENILAMWQAWRDFGRYH